MPNKNGLIRSDEEIGTALNIQQVFFEGEPTVMIDSKSLVTLFNRIYMLENYLKALDETYELIDTNTGQRVRLIDFSPK